LVVGVLVVPYTWTLGNPTRKWRNWQTHQLEGLAIARSCRFKSYLPHHSTQAGSAGLRFYMLRLTPFTIGLAVALGLFGDVLPVFPAGIQARDVILETNLYRKQNHLPALKESALLDRAAALKAKDMFARQYWSHDDPTGKATWQWFDLVGYKFNRAGENLARGFTTAASVIAAWRKSPAHSANLLHKGYTETGVAVAQGVFDGKQTEIVVEMFANRADPTLRHLPASKQPRMTSHMLSGFLFAALLAQTPQPPAAAVAVTEVRQMVTDARKDIETYGTAGGAAGAADHPAVKWNAALWQVHDRAPQSEAGAIAAVEAIRLLIRAELWDRAHARVESLAVDDRAWERVPTVIYEEGIARKSFEYTIATLSQTAASTNTPSIKSAALIVIGRVHRRQGDLSAATRSLQEARAAAPGTPQADEAVGLIYEIEHLSIGLPAPPISGTPRNARRAITLESFRGKPIVLVFWAST
jgi:hypothetical protein